MEIIEKQKPLTFDFNEDLDVPVISPNGFREYDVRCCLLYTSDAADE